MGCCITKKSNKIKKVQAPINLHPVPSKPPPETDLLYIITTHFNPAAYSRRIQLHQEFCSRFSDNPSIVIITVECAFENQPYQVTIPNNTPYHIQVRSNSRLWIKECLMNIALNNLKTDHKFLQNCKYVAWVDDDIEFSDPFFLTKLKKSLSEYTVVQMFNQAYFLDANQNLLETFISFGFYYATTNLNLAPNQYGHPGYAWATTKENILAMGEFYDCGILGNGDKHMAGAFIGKSDEEGFLLKHFPMSEGYKTSLKQWQDRVYPIFKGKLGFVDMEIRHHWHGSKDDRQYMYRWKILMEYQFNPLSDLVKENGIYRLKENKKTLEKEIYGFFKGRNEDTKVNEEYFDERIPLEGNNWKKTEQILVKFDNKVEKNIKTKENNDKVKKHKKIKEKFLDDFDENSAKKGEKSAQILKENPEKNATYIMFYPTTESEAQKIEKNGFKNFGENVNLFKNFEDAKNYTLNNNINEPVVVKALMKVGDDSSKLVGEDKKKVMVNKEKISYKKSVYLFESKKKKKSSSASSNY